MRTTEEAWDLEDRKLCPDCERPSLRLEDTPEGEGLRCVYCKTLWAIEDCLEVTE
jgi:hypothetical protein